MSKLKKSTVEFNVGTKRVSFNVWHNMPNTLGLSLVDAVNNWAVRTKEYTPESLCKYIASKNTGHICTTEKPK
jgi:hypothetical protein